MEEVVWRVCPRVIQVFTAASREMAYDDFPSLTCYEEMVYRSVPFPPEGYTPIELSLSGSNEASLWKLYTVVEARLPSYIRQLLSLGVDVHPDGNTSNQRFVFTIPHSKSSKQILQQVMRPFWSEMLEFRNQGGVNVELTFGQRLDSTQPLSSLVNKAIPDGVNETIMQFNSQSSSKELHLPASLNRYERLQVHETAENLGLSHSTVGEGKDRHIVITKRK